MALDFPNAPAVGATFSSGGVSWVWDGTKWAQGVLAGNPLIVAPPVAASWTQRGFAGTTSLVDNSLGPIMQETASQNGDVLRTATIASPSTPYTIDAVITGFNSGYSAISYQLGWTDGTKYEVIQLGWNGANPNNKTVAVTRWANNTTFSAASYGAHFFEWLPQRIFARIADDGTNVSFAISGDGVTFLSLYSVAKASGYLGASGYTNVGWGVDFNIGTFGTQLALMAATLISWRVH